MACDSLSPPAQAVNPLMSKTTMNNVRTGFIILPPFKKVKISVLDKGAVS